MYSWWFGVSPYGRLAQRDSLEECAEKETHYPSQHTAQFRLCTSLVSVLLLTLGAVLGYSAGTLTLHYERQPEALANSVPRVPIGFSKEVFQYNSSFASSPPKKGGSESVWDSMIPDGLGYIKDAALAPNTSILSVFHQLHCLYTVRRAYYSNAEEGELEDFDLGKDRKPHVAHCFDYLRQSILCCADSSIEPAVDAVNGFLGAGFPRQCRDFEELKAWAEERRVFGAHGFLVLKDEER